MRGPQRSMHRLGIILLLFLGFSRIGIADPSDLPNFHTVTPRLYRGGQPTRQGFEELKKLGVKTVINLRSFSSDRKAIEGLGFNYEPIFAKAWHPEEEDVIHFLKIVAEERNTPVFVHCAHGSDRTGTMIAIYRIVVEGWSKEKAIKEMTQKEFGFHPIWQNLIEFIKDLDVESIQKKLGIRGTDS